MTERGASPPAASSAESRFRVIFGTVAIIATLAATRKHLHEADQVLEILVTVALSLVVVHTFADYLARRFDIQRRPTPREAIELLSEELPLLAGAVVPCALYLLASLGIVGEAFAYRGAVGYGVLFLFVTGYMAARPGSLPHLVFSGFVFSAVGIVVIAIEASIH